MPKDLADARPDLKVIEAKLRISARIIEGNASDIVDFVYMIKTGQAMRVRDYSPKTTLESAVAADQIEVTAENENSTATGVEAGGAVTPLTLGGSHNQNSKKSESSRYKQVCRKTLFWQAAPPTVSMESSIEFDPHERAPWRVERSLLSRPRFQKVGEAIFARSRVRPELRNRRSFPHPWSPQAQDQAEVGVYLASDTQAAAVAEELRMSQERVADLRAKQSSSGNLFQTISLKSGSLFGSKETAKRRQELEDAEKAVRLAEDRLQRWAE